MKLLNVEKCSVAFLLVIMFIGNTGVAFASEAPKDWWKRNSLIFPQMHEELLIHAELLYSCSLLEGNSEGSVHRGSGGLFVRKRRFTTAFQFQVASTDMETTDGGRIDTEYYFFEPSLRYDLLKKIYLHTGYMYEKDTKDFLDKRDIAYTGIGYGIISGDDLNLTLYAAGGFQKDKYDPTIDQLLGISTNETPIGFFQETLSYVITPQITCNQMFRVIYEFDSSGEYSKIPPYEYSGEVNRSRINFNLGFDFKLTRYMTFNVSYNFAYNSNPWPVVEQKDSRIKMGIKVSY